MAKSLIIFISLFLLTITSHAKNATFSECVAYAAELNKYFPQKSFNLVLRVYFLGATVPQTQLKL